MRLFFVLTLKEIKDIFFAKTTLLFLLLTSFMIGYSFLTAVELYREQSRAAVGNPLYASGFEPVPGVFGPTCGGLFVLFSLFLPLVIIPLLSREKKHGTLAILTQLPFSFKEIIVAKGLASWLLLLFVLALTIPALLLWKVYGGHLPGNELLVLMTGYLFYGILIVSVSLLAASLFEGTANALLFALFLILLSWLIDFGKNMKASSFLAAVSAWTVTRMLKFFENGILSLAAIMYFIFLSAFFFFLAYILLRFDLKSRWKSVSVAVILFPLVWLTIAHLGFNVDLTESRRNSFSSVVAGALKKLSNLEIDIYLKRGDSRFEDYQRSFLNKLALVRNDVKIKLMTGKKLEDNYGLFCYRVNGKSDKTYSNSEEEIFGLIFKLAGFRVVPGAGEKAFPGYPLVVKGKLSMVRYTYYGVIPLVMVLVSGLRNSRLLRRIKDDTG